jgi:hypothetical protein
MDIIAQDCRLEGATGAGETVWIRGTHLPTGVVATLPHAVAQGAKGKRALMNALQREVDEYMQNELDKL